VKLVVDASVAVKWFLDDRPDELHSVQALAVVAAIERRETELLTPCHWMIEVIGVLARIEPSVVDDAVLLLDDMRPALIHSPPLLRRAAEISVALDHHLFDTLYHAVALEEGAMLVTADEVYFAKAQALGAIQWLADFSG
jgi:predicted nucleic acid-binding protein